MSGTLGTRSCAIRRGMSKKRATAVFDLSLLSRLCSWKTVVHRYPVDEEQMHRRPQRTRRPIRNWVSVTSSALPKQAKEWGARNTRKDAKGDERCGLGGSCHIARPDIGRGSGRVTAIAHRNPPTPPDMPFSASGG